MNLSPQYLNLQLKFHHHQHHHLRKNKIKLIIQINKSKHGKEIDISIRRNTFLYLFKTWDPRISLIFSQSTIAIRLIDFELFRLIFIFLFFRSQHSWTDPRHSASTTLGKNGRKGTAMFVNSLILFSINNYIIVMSRHILFCTETSLYLWISCIACGVFVVQWEFLVNRICEYDYGWVPIILSCIYIYI